MSDGISEGYRASRASKSFETLWTDAQVESILLDIKSHVEDLSLEEMYLKIANETTNFRVTHDDGWEVEYNWGTRFQTSIQSEYADKFPRVRVYKLEVSDKMHRSFTGKDLKQLMREALIFLEWCRTDEGLHAVEVYNDW